MMETVNDIINEWRGIRPDCDECLSNHTCDYINRLIDRMDAAYKRDMQSIVETRERDMENLREENERLKEALKPVLECDTKNLINVGTNCINAVVESERIYNGVAK